MATSSPAKSTTDTSKRPQPGPVPQPGPSRTPGLDQVINYVGDLSKQVQKLNSPSKPPPSEEQLHAFVKSVVQSLHTLTQKAPGTVKDKVRAQFGQYWDYHNNKPSKTAPMTAMQLEITVRTLGTALQQCKTVLTKEKEDAEKQEPAKEKKFHGEDTTKGIVIPEAKIGKLIGPQGSVLKQIEECSECRINVEQGIETVFMLTGPKDGIDVGEKIINDLMTKGFSTALLQEGSIEDTIKVAATRLPEVLGVGWKNMKILREKFQVEVGEIESDRPKGPRSTQGQARSPKPVSSLISSGSPPPISPTDQKMVPIPLAGKPENVESVKKAITDLAEMGYSTETHPEFIHEFVEVPEGKRPRVIGTKGSEIRHIQNSYSVNVMMPSPERGVFHENVLVSGLPEGVTRAVNYINGIITRPDRREEKEFGDNYDQEEEVDCVASSYLIKSR